MNIDNIFLKSGLIYVKVFLIIMGKVYMYVRNIRQKKTGWIKKNILRVFFAVNQKKYVINYVL